MMGVLRPVPEGDNEAAQVVTGDSGYIRLLGAQELGEVTRAGDDPGDGLRAFAFRPGVGLIGHQCILKCHHLSPLTLAV